MARKDSHEGQVVAELQQMRDQYKDVRETLVQEIADVDSGIERINLAINNGVRPPAKRRRKRKQGTAKRTTAKRGSAKRGSAKSTTAQSSNGNGSLTASIKATVASAKRPMTARQVAKKMGILDATARRHLSGLLSEGSIKVAGQTKGPGRAANMFAIK